VPREDIYQDVLAAMEVEAGLRDAHEPRVRLEAGGLETFR